MMTNIDLNCLKTVENPDMKCEIYGELLNGNGVKIRLSNVEYIDENIISDWKAILKHNGYTSVIQHEISSGFVTITCRPTGKIPLINITIILLGIVLILRFMHVV